MYINVFSFFLNHCLLLGEALFVSSLVSSAILATELIHQLAYALNRLPTLQNMKTNLGFVYFVCVSCPALLW